MRAMALVGSFGLDHLKLIERPMPEPRHNEVVIRMAAVSLNYRDMDMVLGTYPFKFPLPLVPTSDGVFRELMRQTRQFRRQALQLSRSPRLLASVQGPFGRRRSHSR